MRPPNKLFSGIFGHFLIRGSIIQLTAGLLLLAFLFLSFGHTSSELAAEQGRTLANSTLAATSDAIFTGEYAGVVDYCFNVIKVTPNILSITYSKRNGEELIINGKQWAIQNKTQPYYAITFEGEKSSVHHYPYELSYTGHGLAFSDSFNYSQPVFIGGKDWGVLTITFSTEGYKSIVFEFYRAIVIFTIASGLLSLFVFYLSSRRVRNQIQSFGEIAKSLSAGHLTFKADESSLGEIGVLAKSINTMSDSLREKSRRISLLVNIVEQTNDAFILFDSSRHIIFSNEALSELTGYSLSHFSGMSLEEFIGRKYLNLSGLLSDVGFADNGSIRHLVRDCVLTKQDQTILNIEVRCEHIKNDEGGPENILIVLSDIDARIQAENLMHELNADLSATLKAIPDLLFEVDNNGRYLNIWAHNTELLAAQREVLMGRTVQEMLPPEAANTIMSALAEAERNGFSHGHIFRLELPQGETWFELSTALKTTTNSTSSGNRFIVLSRDISYRKRAEQQLRIAATAFESQEGMYVTDAQGNILRVNRAFTSITGYEAAEVVGRNPRVFGSGRHDTTFYADMYKSIGKTGVWEGEIWNRRKNGELYPEQLLISAVKGSKGEITNYVASFADITESKATADKVERLAFYDPLTNLPNRRLLFDRLKHALISSARSGKNGALLFLDLDNFKTLNDTLGHDTGDLLLQIVAQRLESSVREGDTVARLGGDEFVVMLEDLQEDENESAAQTEIVANKILELLNQPYMFGDHVYHNTPSIGITLFNGEGHESEELIKQADIAMYQAKKAGRNTLRFFDPQMQRAIHNRANLESELRKALVNEEFRLHYQVQMHSSGSALGAEVLIRWLSPERGLVNPGEFIPLSEETGLIIPIGQWVMESACIQLKAWQLAPSTSKLTLSVNVSAKQFRQPDFADQVRELISRHAINPKLFKLELTESLLLDNVEDTINTMNELHDIGVNFSLDDFGTGYSSLQYLKRLPLNQLKIDQSFVRGITSDLYDESIVRTIIAMARNMNMSVIAEGVETEQQRDILYFNNCTTYQGYLFGRPVPIEEFEAKLKQGN